MKFVISNSVAVWLSW